MSMNIPLASLEVRWFFEGKVDQHPIIRDWFETTEPFDKSREVRPPVWAGRLNDQPDVYLIVPGGQDIGVKWREGQLQIKGRLSSSGTQVYCGRHYGRVERWIKWSYSDIPKSYQCLFDAEKQKGLITASVRKTRALRKLRLDTLTGKAHEVDAKTFIDRGLGIELTDLEVDGKAHCSLGFEAFPNDSAMEAAFTSAVGTWLAALTALDLAAVNSRSYPEFLGEVMPRD